MRLAWTPLRLAFAWGPNWPIIRIVLSALPPFALRWLGLGSGAPLLAVVALAQRKALLPAAAACPSIALGGTLTIAGFSFCTAFAQLNTSTSRAAVLTYTMPMMTALLAWWCLGGRPGRRAAWGSGTWKRGPGRARLAGYGSVAANPDASARGLLFPLLAALFWAAGTVATKRWPPVGDRIVITAWQLAPGAACGAVAAPLAGETLPSNLEPRVAWALAYHIVVATALAYVLWARLLDSLSATVSSLTVLAAPVVGVLGAMTLVGDRPSAADAPGFVRVLGAAAPMLSRLGPRPVPTGLKERGEATFP